MYNRSAYRLKKQLAEANNFSEWKTISKEIEQVNAIDKWKEEERTNLYDYKEVRLRFNNLSRHIEQKDYASLMYALGEGIHGNIGGMGSSTLYEKPIFGTKKLIEEYTDIVCESLKLVSEQDISGISEELKDRFFIRASHCFGCSAFMMSGGGMLLYFHIGVLRSLLEQDLLPTIISGSSGGAFAAAIIGTHSKSELLKLTNAKNISAKIARLKQTNYPSSLSKKKALSPEDVEEVLHEFIPDITFDEAFQRTGINLNIPVAPAQNHQTSHLLNATTTPNVYIHEAVKASGALPGYYPPVTLEAKDYNGERKIFMSSRKWADGSITDDLPAKKLARLYGVNHFIVSQVNPLLIPFISDSSSKSSPQEIIKNASFEAAKAWLNASASLIPNKLSSNSPLDKNVKRVLSIVNQKYSGDINILPPFKIPPNMKKIMQHPSEAEIEELITMGERASWPKIDMISTQTKVSRLLNSIIESRNINL